ncbi:SDR family NAD(P)-dependent oxidoreductase [Terrimonas rubra]|uniref:SDR family NAD(P)-dependent oxidoreductase n=1 Tax=Terrimonas rubra TaxID=1035890 RepID=A0ABW6A5B2_9BACT
MNKNIIIVGAGPNLSLGIAEKFAEKNFSIGLISRNEEKLKAQIENFKAKGVKAEYAVADAYNTLQIENAVARLAIKMGSVDVLLYNAAAMKYKNIIDETADDLTDDFKMSVANAFHCVKILHQQLKETNGAVLFTGGGLALYPNVQVGSLSVTKAALRNLAIQLHEVLKEDGIYVGTLTVNNTIRPDSETHSPKILAEKFWEMYTDRAQAELQY